MVSYATPLMDEARTVESDVARHSAVRSMRRAACLALTLLILAHGALVVRAQGPPDQDGDGFPDTADNCVFSANPGQEDADGDQVGDVCDACPGTKSDGPTVDSVVNFKGCALSQLCPCTGPGARSWQKRSSYLHCTRRRAAAFRHAKLIEPAERKQLLRDAKASACGLVHGQAGDMDGDGIADGQDNCSRRWNPKQHDRDADGKGDVCDGDWDGDGVANDVDNCPHLKNEDQKDDDGDGVGNACDKCLDTPDGDDVDGKGCS